MSGLSFCLVSTFYPPSSFGGDAMHVHRLATGLADRGHRVRVVHNPVAHRMLGGTAGAPAGIEHPCVEVVSAPVGPVATTATMTTYLTGAPFGYRRHLERLAAGFDVVHFTNPSLLGGPGALDLGGTGAVRLYTAAEHWLVCPTHTLFRYGREVCTTRTCWRCSLSYRRPPQPWRSTGLLGRRLAHLDALIVPSRFSAELHRQAFPGARIEVLPLLGPTPEALEAAASSTPAVAPYFLFAGRLEAIKGPVPLVRAFARVSGAELVVVGGGSQAGEVARLAGTIPGVRLLGVRPNAEVLALARGARAVVVPSAGYETYGIAAVEAMAMGTPAVVRALGPLPELVEDGGGVAVADDDALADALQELVDDPERAERLGRRAREVATGRLGQAWYFERYLALVADLAAGRGRAA